MTSEVSVINRGASKLGADRITSRADETKVAREMDACFDQVRDAELRRNRWRFSLKRASLSALVTVPIGTIYTTEYQLPTDCLQLIQVGEFYVIDMSDLITSDNAPFSLEGRKILTYDTAPLFIRYVMRATDPTQWDSCFVESLASRLAYETAAAITGSSTAKKEAWADYQQTLNEAIVANAIETPPQAMQDESWISARFS